MIYSSVFLGLVVTSLFGWDVAALSPTCTSTPAVKPNKQPLDARKLANMMTSESLYQKGRYLQAVTDRSNGTRKWGTRADDETIEWIYEMMKATDYYDVYKQTVYQKVWIYDELKITTSANIPLNFLGLQYGTSGEETAELVYIDPVPSRSGCDESTYSKAKGKIVVTPYGSCVNENRAAKKAGAKGVILVHMPREDRTEEALFHAKARVDWFSWEDRENPDETAQHLVGAILNEPTGLALIKQLKAGKTITATIKSKVHTENLPMQNVIAETKAGSKDSVITTGAHTDSVASGPGINDNGSAVIAQMDIALALAKMNANLTNAVRFCWWNNEEDDMTGSKGYANSLSDAERDKIVMNFAWDTIASPNYVFVVFEPASSSDFSLAPVRDSRAIAKTLKDYYRSEGYPTVSVGLGLGRTDYVAFAPWNIPVTGSSTGAEDKKTQCAAKLFKGQVDKPLDPCYHQPCDRLENLNMTAWLMSTKAMAYVIGHYANSIDGIEFPRKVQGNVNENWWTEYELPPTVC